MKIEQKQWVEKDSWIDISNTNLSETAQFVLAFGCKEILENEQRYQEIKNFKGMRHATASETSAGGRYKGCGTPATRVRWGGPIEQNSRRRPTGPP